MNEAALELIEVTKRYGEFTAVDALSLRVGRGQIVGFLGPNGAGKTTTIRMIMSIIYPDAGQIRVLGAPRAMEVKDRIGYLPEERGLYRKMTVEQTLRYFGRLKGVSGRRLRERIDAVLRQVELSDWRRKKVEALSKGMSQKLQFAVTILHEPQLVILDEPFSGLDPLNMEVLKELVLELKRRGTTVIFSTHQMEQAEKLCDSIVLINRGRKLIEGPLDEIRRRFTTRTVLIEGAGDLHALAGLPGVSRAEIDGTLARLALADGTEPNDVLAEALRRVRIERFELHRPDLHDIFVSLVRQDQGGAPVAAAAAAEQEALG